MAVAVKELFYQKGRELIGFLDYCVRSGQLDALFLFLVQEYREQPTAAKALALYDVFYAPEALGKITLRRDLRIRTLLQPLLDRRSQEQQTGPCSLPPILPPKYLFDSIAQQLEGSESNNLRTAADRFDPALTPVQNLPGGKMSEGQRAFVERIWEPHLRPRLVAAGFRWVASVA